MATAVVESIPVPVSESTPTEAAPAIQVTTPVEEPAAPEKDVADEPAAEVPTEKSADGTAVPVVVEPASVEETREGAEVVAEEEVPAEVPAVVEPAAVEETQVEAAAQVEKPAEETSDAVEETQEEATIEPDVEAEPEAPAKGEDSATAAVEAVEVPAEKTEE